MSAVVRSDTGAIGFVMERHSHCTNAGCTLDRALAPGDKACYIFDGLEHACHSFTPEREAQITLPESEWPGAIW